MRDYLYVWHDPFRHYIVASGIEFRDLAPSIGDIGGLALLEHQFDAAHRDILSGLDFVPCADVPSLASEDIYSWGDFVWADYKTQSFPGLAPDELAQLLYFRHRHEPLRSVAVEGLQNTVLGSIHDDGWFMRLFYVEWNQMESALRAATASAPAMAALDLDELRVGETGLWLQNGQLSREEKTLDLDSILNRRLTNSVPGRRP